MPTICAKCQLVRPEDATVPVWQCPGCGVAYNKASDAQRAPASSAKARQHHTRAASAPGSGGFSWIQWLLVLSLILGGFAGYRMALKRDWTDESVDSIASRVGRDGSPAQLAALAASVKPGDVFIFSADWCPNCHEAKGWMAQHGFAYEQCDIDKDHGCKARLGSLGGDGVPYLIVRGHHMRDGFDSREFAAALQVNQHTSKSQQQGEEQ